MYWAGFVFGVLIVVGFTAITKWALDYAGREREEATEPAPKPPTPEPPKRDDYVEAVLLSGGGPTGIPGGFADARAEQRYRELVGTADKLEANARQRMHSGDYLGLYPEIGKAWALRDAARRLHGKLASVETSDGLLKAFVFDERERELDMKVLEGKLNGEVQKVLAAAQAVADAWDNDVSLCSPATRERLLEHALDTLSAAVAEQRKVRP